MTRWLAWFRARPTFAMFLAALVLGLLLLPGVPWTDDARFYVPAAQAYTRWLVRLLSFDLEALSRTAIDAAFSHNREHPPVAKYLMGLGWLVFHEWTGLVSEVTAARIPIVVLWAVSAAVVFRLVATRCSTLAGVFAALAFALMPRVLFDGHAETLDLAVTAFIVLTTEAFLRHLEAPSRDTALLATAYFALALGTKLNAPFALLGLLACWLLLHWPRRAGLFIELAPLPWPLLGMLTLTPLLVIALWPWLYFDTAARLSSYVAFHLRHYPILLYFGGHVFRDDLPPWTTPFVMTAMTLPLPTLTLAALGMGELGSVVRRGRAALLTDARLRLALVALVQVIVQLVAVALPGVPVYGGVKLFLPIFPFIAVLAGLGFARAVEAASTRARGTLFVLALLPGLLGVLVYRGAWLSYYSEWVGGIRGAAERGYERQYYDLAYPEIAAALRSALPKGGKVAFEPNPKEYGPHMKRFIAEGVLPASIELAPKERADVLVLTHERRWTSYPELLAIYRTHELLVRYDILGVPLFSVYRLAQPAMK